MIESIIKEDRLVKPERKLLLIEKAENKYKYEIQVLDKNTNLIYKKKYKLKDSAISDYGLIWFCNKRS